MTILQPIGEAGVLEREGRPPIAWRRTIGTGSTILFLPGYASDMAGSKATALFDWALGNGRSCVLFDYAGCGQSGGDFANETLESWRDDALAVLDDIAPSGPIILVGSSMGGWLMLLVALARADRIAALVGIAAAPDFTDWGYSDTQKATLERDGRLLEDNPYGPEPTLITLAFWQAGERNRLLGGPIPLTCPVRLLHGMADADVPFNISLTLAERLESQNVRVSLMKNGDHRLSTEADIALLIQTAADLLAVL